MLSKLKACQGKQVGIELVNGSKLYGTVLEVSDSTLRLDTDEGIASLLVGSVQIVWESQDSSLSDADMEEIVARVKATANTRYLCFSGSGFFCPRTYICRPPHGCNRFFCPGRFVGAFPEPEPEVPCVGTFYGFVGPGRDKKEGEK
jgi:hypothetical protein